MDLAPHVDNLRHELVVAAETGGDEARALTEQLTAQLSSAARLTLLNALSAAMGEVSLDLAPGSVTMRLRGPDPEFVVTLPPALEPYETARAGNGAPAGGGRTSAPSVPADGEEGGRVRINLRLPVHLKARVEGAAGQEGLSVNAWLARAVALALEPGGYVGPPGHRRHMGQQDYAGWVH